MPNTDPKDKASTLIAALLGRVDISVDRLALG